MKILVTGGTGQLAQEIKLLLPQASYPTRAELDLSRPQSINAYLKQNKFDLIINCAAYTKVDLAEKERHECSDVNTVAPGILGNECSRVIHFSTDYVFDGNNNRPYLETDLPNPVNFYGESKLLGEEALFRANSESMIIRTSWLYSKNFGNNFFKTIKRLSQEREKLGVVFDQVGTPTNASNLAKVVVSHLIDKSPSGLFHYSDEGVASWFDFALEINRLYPSKCSIDPIRSLDFQTIALRPSYTVLDKSKIKKCLSLDIKDWKTSLIVD